MTCVLGRQYKDLKPAQQALRQPQAPHHAGLFALGSWLRPAAAARERRLKRRLSQNLMTFSYLVPSREFAGFCKMGFEPS
jgi:hypothetical protein